jgi:hypothetical protein
MLWEEKLLGAMYTINGGQNGTKMIFLAKPMLVEFFAQRHKNRPRGATAIRFKT